MRQVRQLIPVDIPVDGEALVQNKIGQHVDPLAETPGLDFEPIAPKNAKFSDDSGVVRDR